MAEYKNTYKVLEDWGITITDEIVRLLSQNRKNASGVLSNSVDFQIDTSKKDRVELRFIYAKYGNFVLSGRRAGAKQPPTSMIEQWIKQKKIPVGGGRTTKIVPRKRGQSNTDEIKQVAFLIARAIALKGIKSFNFLKPLEDQRKKGSDMLTDVKNAMIKDGINNLKLYVSKSDINKKGSWKLSMGKPK
jgi:hypothetical protein